MKKLVSHLPPALLFLAMTFWATYPLWLAPGERLLTSGDTFLNSWIVHWVQYAVYNQTAGFFDANIYWPHDKALAYGELMLTQAALALPARWLGGGPAAVHNFSLMEGFFFSALGSYALAWHFFKSRGAATVAGIAYGFALYRTHQSDHIQLVHGEFLPLMILGAERILTDPSRRAAGARLLGASALAQWLASWYWAVFSFWAFVPYVGGRLWLLRRTIAPREIAALAAPLLIAAVLVVPFVVPYLDLRSRNIMIRPPETLAPYRAVPADFLSPPPRSLAWGWAFEPHASRDSNNERDLFPGLMLMAAALAAASLLANGRKCPGAANNFPLALWFLVALLPTSFCFGDHMSIGGREIPTHYNIAAKIIPFTDQVRVPARWILPALLGWSLIAGYAWLRFFGAGDSRPRRIAGMLAAASLAVESLTTPLWIVPAPASPPAWVRFLNDRPFPAAALLLPTEEPTMMVEAAFLRQPLVNGSNGYFPPLHRVRMRELSRFPAPDVLAALVAMHVRYVVILEGFPAPAGSGGWNEALASAAIAGVHPVAGALVAELPPSPDPDPALPDIGAARLPR